MRPSSTHAAATRAAQAALPRPSQDEDFDRYLIIDDSDEDLSAIFCVLRKRFPHALEARS